MKKVLQNHLEVNLALNDHQHGFRFERSCLGQLLSLYNEILKGIEEGGNVAKDPSQNIDKQNVVKTALRKNKNQVHSQKELIFPESFVIEKDSPKMTISPIQDKFSEDQKDLDARVKALIGRSEDMVKLSDKKVIKPYVCQVCEKEGQWTTIRDHVEANHLEGILIPCNICRQTFSTRNALRQHQSRLHRNSIC